ncbi:TonB-dependent receptor [Rhizomicrobium electricum]|nr:TonB-dependent receptor [Rhizomicrobium electricum]NIJ50754.1 TonB-dependent receptor [Rhizomicrobium electricum]
MSCMLFGGVSVLALGMVMPAAAQTQTMETVTVTGQRAAIQSAVKIKENADQIVDSIVADDAGKLPDRSITEVLQRVSGVTITHFNNLGNPDNYTVEGSGPTVRGLPGGTSTLNGHNAFSANNGRQLLWGDVPSELMAAVDVYKTYTPDQIEGGLGGTINLRTHLPFDFDGTTIRGAVSASYGDLVKQLRPRASVMGSTRWDTKWGEMGFLLDLSYDDSSYRNDAIQVEPYFPHTNVLENYTLQNVSGTVTPVLKANPTTYWMPGGFDYHTSTGFHKRGGVYAAFQWRPSEKLSINATLFSSANDQNERSYNFAASNGGHNSNITYTLNPTDTVRNDLGKSQLVAALSGGTPGANDPLYHLYDSGNNLVYTNAYYDTGFVFDKNIGWNPNYDTIMGRCGDASKLCSKGATRAGASKSYARTTDIALSANWTPNDNWTVRSNASFIYSKSNGTSLEVEGDVIMSPYGMDLRGAYPTIVMADASSLKTSSGYYWNDTMYNRNKNYGQEIQATVDVEYKLNAGIVKAVKFGVRGDIRTEHDQNAGGYDWKNLSATWGTMYWWSDPAAKADTVLYQFPNFFRGEVNLPGPALFPEISKVEMYDVNYYRSKYGDSKDTIEYPYEGRRAKHYKTVNVAGYAMASFAMEDVLGMTMSGNAGARLVYVDNRASGFITTWGNTLFRETSSGPLLATDKTSLPVQGGRVSWTLLPAFNVQFMPNDKLHIRFAGSITAEQPTFAGIGGGSTVGTEGNNKILTGYNIDSDNPNLKPQIGRNFDMSVEWYGDGGSKVYTSLFYKSIKHRQVTGYVLQDMPWVIGTPQLQSNGTDCVSTGAPDYSCLFVSKQTVTKPTVVKSAQNTNKETLIRGVEFGFTKYADWEFVPSYLRGFGMDANFTYIDSKAPGNYSFDMLGNNISAHMPVAGLSHYAYNATLMYDRDPLSFRLAYNWRSKYLMSASGWNTQGTYAAGDNYVDCPQNNNASAGWGGNLIAGQCRYSLPVWSKSFGSLDAGMDYKIDEHFSFNIQSQNLLNTKAKTTMGYAAQEHGRSWFVADRRVSMELRVEY